MSSLKFVRGVFDELKIVRSLFGEQYLKEIMKKKEIYAYCAWRKELSIFCIKNFYKFHYYSKLTCILKP